MRLIDADAFRKVLSEWEMKYDRRRSFYDFAYGATSAYEHAGDLLDEMPTIKTFTLADIEEQYAKGMEKGLEERPHGEWIPCSERLPDKAEARYWVCTDGGYQCQCRWTNDVFGLGKGNTWAWKIFDIPQYEKVIAWMPLPKPYKKEGEAE